MSTEGRQPQPEFDDTRYERPQKDWICGHACKGCPCRQPATRITVAHKKKIKND